MLIAIFWKLITKKIEVIAFAQPSSRVECNYQCLYHLCGYCEFVTSGEHIAYNKKNGLKK